MNSPKNPPPNRAYGVRNSKEALQDILSDVLEPSPRSYTDSGRHYSPGQSDTHAFERAPLALSDLRAPHGSYRVRFSEFLD